MKFLIGADRAGDLQDLIKRLCHMVGSEEPQTSRDEERLTIHDMIRVPRYGDKVGLSAERCGEQLSNIYARS
ncbi:hypothetical protein L3476_01030 [Paenibacillus thiaminolyticus]|uniref:hypothetical protein n=1 Tax=Paenibacillus thiaminolyticus TaxID=49283 RepID=UPI0023507B83|nr:hypothetical protein [Paenibacillus thiaminolyticus]WCR27399.1 hypothetical protein L3476_01030 [Paenibacillus thiaminolyticus]